MGKGPYWGANMSYGLNYINPIILPYIIPYIIMPFKKLRALHPKPYIITPFKEFRLYPIFATLEEGLVALSQCTGPKRMSLAALK